MYRYVWRIERCRGRATETVILTEAVRTEMPRIGTRKLYYMLHQDLRTMGVERDKYFDILRATPTRCLLSRIDHITTNFHYRLHKHKKLVADMERTRPEQIWVFDITYVGSRSNNLYLALITDAYSKKIVGYDLSNSLDTNGALRALTMANKNRYYPDEFLIHHSDRRIEYCSYVYQKNEKYNMTTGMTESYDANAILNVSIES